MNWKQVTVLIGAFVLSSCTEKNITLTAGGVQPGGSDQAETTPQDQETSLIPPYEGITVQEVGPTLAECKALQAAEKDESHFYKKWDAANREWKIPDTARALVQMTDADLGGLHKANELGVSPPSNTKEAQYRDTKQFAIVLRPDSDTSGASVIVCGADKEKNGEKRARSFHFDNEGLKGVSYEDFYSLRARQLADGRIMLTASPHFSNKAEAKSSKKKKTARIANASYGLYFKEIKKHSELWKRMEQICTDPTKKIYRRFALLDSRKAPKTAKEFADMLGLQARRLGDGTDAKAVSQSALPQYGSIQTGAEFGYWFYDGYLNPEKNKDSREKLMTWIDQYLEIPSSQLVDAGEVTPERVSKDLRRSERGYVEYKYVRYTPSLTRNSNVRSLSSALACGAKLHAWAEVVQDQYYLIDGKVKRVEDVTIIFNNTSAFRYTPEIEI